jgi:hypothetical protein
MKLIIREYLASLRERGELDAILPDLLSQMGLNVFSRPGRGTRQDGVDVAAVGKLGAKTAHPKVYLLSIKPGDLTRQDWSGDKVQDLRPSLNEILDSYIPNRLPAEHKDKVIVICICVGGDIQESVRPSVEGFIRRNQKRKIRFEEWNGDKLAAMIQEQFLREDLLPADSRSRLRKSLAMLDEPDTSYAHFSTLIRALADIENRNGRQRVTAIRQMSICLWILFAWGRQAHNLEAPYRASELTLLHAWPIMSFHLGKKDKTARNVEAAFTSILEAYHQITSEYLHKCVFPHADKRDGLSSAVRTTSSVDVNLKLFDVLGRLALRSLWLRWHAEISQGDAAMKDSLTQEQFRHLASMKNLIANNRTLLLPIEDGQGIDITIAALALAIDSRNHDDLRQWLSAIVRRASFAYRVHGRYPANLHSYSELLDHPIRDDDYRRSVTGGSILYPMLAFVAALLHFDDVYSDVSTLKTQLLGHCNFQFWYPDESSENALYTNRDSHGVTLSDASVDKPMADLVRQAFTECANTPYFQELSAVKSGLWPIVVVACRHYRLPLPLHFFSEFRSADVSPSSVKV